MKDIFFALIVYLWAFLPFVILIIAYLLNKIKWYFRYVILFITFHFLDGLFLFILSRDESKNYKEHLSVWVALLIEFNLLIFLVIILYLVIKDVFKKVNSKVEKIVEDNLKKNNE